MAYLFKYYKKCCGSLGIPKLKYKYTINIELCLFLPGTTFCHTEEAKTNVSEKVEKDGYCIVPIENCPNPY